MDSTDSLDPMDSTNTRESMDFINSVDFFDVINSTDSFLIFEIKGFYRSIVFVPLFQKNGFSKQFRVNYHFNFCKLFF